MGKEKGAKEVLKRSTPTSARLEYLRTIHRIQMQRMLARFICVALAVTSASAVAIFYLQGFHVLGFHLADTLMHWIGGVTIGCVASLSTMVYATFFRNPRAP